MKIAIAIAHNFPSYSRKFIESFLLVVQSFYAWNATIGNKHELVILINKDGWIDRMREMLAKEALEKEVDCIMWMDSDQRFPPTLVQQMVENLEANPEVDAITGLYIWKQPPFVPHAYAQYDPMDDRFLVACGFPLNKPFRVEGAGFGCLMMRSSLLKKRSYPRFQFQYGVYGEDLYFFREFFKQGIPFLMLCDPTINCTHLTEQEVDIQSYINYNKLEVKDGMIQVDNATVDRLTKFEKALTDKFKSEIDTGETK